MRDNRLRHLLATGQPTLGTRILSSWPTVIELIGRSAMFDYVEFSAEYAPYDHRALEEMGRAVELFDHLTGHNKANCITDDDLFHCGTPHFQQAAEEMERLEATRNANSPTSDDEIKLDG